MTFDDPSPFLHPETTNYYHFAPSSFNKKTSLPYINISKSCSSSSYESLVNSNVHLDCVNDENKCNNTPINTNNNTHTHTNNYTNNISSANHDLNINELSEKISKDKKKCEDLKARLDHIRKENMNKLELIYFQRCRKERENSSNVQNKDDFNSVNLRDILKL